MSATTISWMNFKMVVSNRSLIMHYLDMGSAYLLKAADGFFEVQCKLVKGSTEATDFETNYQAACNDRIEKLSGISQVPMVSIQKEEGDYLTQVSHNFCDNTTWAGAPSSEWTISASAGYVTIIEKGEAQFLHDFKLSGITTIYMDFYAWVGGGAKMVVNQIAYDSVLKMFEIGNSHYTCPPVNTEMPESLTTLQYNQPTAYALYGDDTPGQLSHITIYTDSDTECGGSYATVGFVTKTRAI